MNDNDFPAGARLFREYQVQLRDGAPVHIAFTLADESFESPVRTLARNLGAEAFGLISLIEPATGARHLLVWTHDDRELAITGVEDEGVVRDELRVLVGHYICVFLGDIAALVPQLGDVAPPPATDDNVRQ